MAEHLTLPKLLDGYNYATLTAITGSLNLKGTGTKKVDLIRILSAYFADPKVIRATFAGLTPLYRDAVQILQRLGGRASLVTLRERLRSLHPSIQLPEPTRYGYYPPAERPSYRSPDSVKLADILAFLVAHGLVLGVVNRGPYGSQTANLEFNLAGEYAIPEEVRRHLPPPPAEQAWQVKYGPEPAQTRESSARLFQRDLYLYWVYVGRAAVELTAKNLIAKRHLTAINASLQVRETIQSGQVETDFPRLVFIRTLLMQLGLIASEAGVLVARPNVADFFALDPLERVKRCLEAYVACTGMNELVWATDVHTMTGGPASSLSAPQLLQDARRAVLLYLRPAVDWLQFELLAGRVRAMQYEFLFSRSLFPPQPYYRPDHPYTATTNLVGWNFPRVTSDEDGWDKVESCFIQEMLVGPLFWMGLVDLGFSNPDAEHPQTFRLTDLGRWLFANGPAPRIPQGAGQVVVQPDFTVTAFDPVSDAVLYQLEQFAERISAERAVVLRLTQQSVYAGQRRGWDAGRIQEYLQELTGQALPANVARTLEEWQARHERIRVSPQVAILHAASPLDLEALARDAEMASWLSEQPAANLVVLPEKRSVDSLLAALVKRNWLPLVTRRGGEIPPGVVQVDADGRLSFSVKTPDIYLHGFLARFADPDPGQGGYRLTPGSIRRAATSGISAPQIIADLEKITQAPLSPALSQRILAWAGHYGQARLEETYLLYLQDAKTLQELARDPEIAKYLHVIPQADVRAMARIRLKDLPRVQQLLEEKGVEIKRQE